MTSPEEPFYSPIPWSSLSADAKKPIYDLSSLTTNYRFESNSPCPFCGYCITWSSSTLEHRSVLCTPDNRNLYQETIKTNFFTMWFKKPKVTYCDLPGVHKHYSCLECKMLWVVVLPDLKAK